MKVVALLMSLSQSMQDLECWETCEVLEMEFVRQQGCDCICYDSSTKSIDVLMHPECVDVE